MEQGGAEGLGYSAAAYAKREKGYSPEPIRDAVWELVKGHVGGRVLDAGSGSGEWLARLASAERAIDRLVSVDIVDAGASAVPGVEFHLGDLSHDRLPCRDAALDWVFALELLEHLANPRRFVAEAYRCLAPGGRLVVTTPSVDCLTARLSYLFRGYFPPFCDHDYLGSGHITPISSLDLRRMAREAGFSSTELHFSLPGRIPRTALYWQQIAPWLRGPLWSDSLVAVLTK